MGTPLHALPAALSVYEAGNILTDLINKEQIRIRRQQVAGCGLQ